MRLVVVSTQDDFLSNMGRLPSLGAFMFEQETSAEVDLFLCNIYCDRDPSSGRDQSESRLRTPIMKKCLDVIAAVSQFKSFNHELHECDSPEACRMIACMQIGKFSLPDQSPDQRLVVITGDNVLLDFAQNNASRLNSTTTVINPFDLA